MVLKFAVSKQEKVKDYPGISTQLSKMANKCSLKVQQLYALICNNIMFGV